MKSIVVNKPKLPKIDLINVVFAIVIGSLLLGMVGSIFKDFNSAVPLDGCKVDDKVTSVRDEYNSDNKKYERHVFFFSGAKEIHDQSDKFYEGQKICRVQV